MKLEIIDTEQYVLAVYNEEIKEGDLFCRVDTKMLFSTLKGSNPCIIRDLCRKVITYRPKSNVKALDLPLLPDIQDDVTCEEWFNELLYLSGDDREKAKLYIKIGYDRATEKYNFTRQDLEDLVQNICDWQDENKKQISSVDVNSFVQKYTQSKIFKLPKYFIAETELIEINLNADRIQYLKQIKTQVINGKKYLVGKYTNENI
jgi:hypothetical protein